jgi:hypothetical protein
MNLCELIWICMNILLRLLILLNIQHRVCLSSASISCEDRVGRKSTTSNLDLLEVLKFILTLKMSGQAAKAEGGQKAAPSTEPQNPPLSIDRPTPTCLPPPAPTFRPRGLLVRSGVHTGPPCTHHSTILSLQ